MPGAKSRSLPTQEGLREGYEAVLQMPGATSDYAQQMRNAMTIDAPGSNYAVGSVIKCDTPPTPVMHDNVPLKTYEKYNMTLDPSVLVRNN
jgi:hypothetical protein